MKELPDHRARRWLYIEVARAFKSSPKEARETGIKRLRFISQNMSANFSNAWEDLLTKRSDSEVLKVLACPFEPYESLRQTCPLTFIVSKKTLQERRIKWKSISSKNS